MKTTLNMAFLKTLRISLLSKMKVISPSNIHNNTTVAMTNHKYMKLYVIKNCTWANL